MDSETITFALAVIILSISIYFFVGNSVENLGFSGAKFFKGEFWRLFTFSFVHLNLAHLIGNIIALVITTLLSFEIGLKGEYFILLFFVASSPIALIEGMFFPALIIAGASLGVYSILGGISISGRRLIPLYFFIPLIVLSIFLNQVFSDSISTVGTVFHLFGFIFGITFYYGLIKYNNRKKAYLGVEG